MFKLKIFISVTIFSFLLITTSIIKNQTREIEKKINNLSESIFYKERDINESQLDYSYLTSPSIIEQKINDLGLHDYSPMEYSKIFLNISNFLNLENKFVIQQNQNAQNTKTE